MDTHHHDSGSEATGIAAWMMATLVFVIGLILLAVLVLWAPWGDGDSGADPVDRPAPQEQAPGESGESGESDRDVDIEGDINVDDGQ